MKAVASRTAFAYGLSVPKNENESLLARARRRRNLTQEQIAAQLDVSQTQVSEWETRAATPRVKNWNAIADAYGVSFNRLAKFFGEACAS